MNRSKHGTGRVARSGHGTDGMHTQTEYIGGYQLGNVKKAKSLDAVRQDMAERAKARPVKYPDGRRKPCESDGCPTPHLKGSKYCNEHWRLEYGGLA